MTIIWRCDHRPDDRPTIISTGTQDGDHPTDAGRTIRCQPRGKLMLINLLGCGTGLQLFHRSAGHHRGRRRGCPGLSVRSGRRPESPTVRAAGEGSGERRHTAPAPPARTGMPGGVGGPVARRPRYPGVPARVLAVVALVSRWTGPHRSFGWRVAAGPLIPGTGGARRVSGSIRSIPRPPTGSRSSGRPGKARRPRLE